jgi:hypothetical protein
MIIVLILVRKLILILIPLIRKRNQITKRIARVAHCALFLFNQKNPDIHWKQGIIHKKYRKLHKNTENFHNVWLRLRSCILQRTTSPEGRLMPALDWRSFLACTGDRWVRCPMEQTEKMLVPKSATLKRNKGKKRFRCKLACVLCTQCEEISEVIRVTFGKWRASAGEYFTSRQHILYWCEESPVPWNQYFSHVGTYHYADYMEHW